jgi:acyl-CoA synthetase (AMP-forming)/AMP-acid ligase II
MSMTLERATEVLTAPGAPFEMEERVIRGGENIYCVEVGNVLYQHPEVMDAAVVGIPHRVLGEGSRSAASHCRATPTARS